MINSKRINNEEKLYPTTINLFNKSKHIFVEVPYFNKRIDLVFASNKIKNLYAVEAKINNWRKAIKQATINQLFAQFSYVAMPEWKIKNFNNLTYKYFTTNKIGLISVGKNAKIIIPAKRNNYFKKSHYRLMKERLRKRIGKYKKKFKRNLVNGKIYKFL